jgi:hypothetical protein
LWVFQLLNKSIRFGLILSPHNKVVFFLLLLISLGCKTLNAQSSPNDTLKKVSSDTLFSGDDESLDEKITYSAEDSIVAFPESGKVILYGKAKVVYGTMKMNAAFMEIDYKHNLVLAYGKKDSTGKNIGNPEFDDGAEPLRAEKIMYNLKSKRGKIYNALTKQGELLVIGNEIKKDSTNIIYMKNMKCIPCQEEDARTIFRATKAKIIPNDKIVTGPMYLEIAGIPTPIGLPFGFFPNTKKQHNGILIPTYGNSQSQGFNLRNGGFYWGINDKADLIFRGDIYANGSWALNVTNDYKMLYKSSGSAYVGYKKYNLGDKDIPSSYSIQKAYEIRWLHTQDNKSDPSVRFSANVNYINNQNINRLNEPAAQQYLQNTFMSNINFTKSYKYTSLSLNATHSQNSQTGLMDIVLPSLTFNVNRFFPFKRENAVKQNALDKLGISYLLTANNKLSGKEQTIFQGNPIDSLNSGITHNLPISTSFNVLKYITVSPAVNLSAYMTDKTIRKEYVYIDTVNWYVKTRTVKRPAMAYDASFSTAINTQVYFDYLFTRGRIKQIRHFLIPTLAYTYRPDFGEAQYGIWKKVQRDTFGNIMNYSIYEKSVFSSPAMGKQNALSINLNNNLEGKFKQQTDTGTTFKKITLLQNVNLNTNYNFAADSFKMSTINLSGRTTILKNISVVFGALFDPYVYKNGEGRRFNQLYVNYDKRLARFVRGTLAITTSISNTTFKSKSKKDDGKKTSPSQDLPWSMNAGYNLTLTDDNNTRIQPSHALSAGLNLLPTKYWKMNVTTGFDFNSRKLSYTTFKISRDLKCWEANVVWVPFGANKSYFFTMNLKTAMLSEFKIPRTNQWFDNL